MPCYGAQVTNSVVMGCIVSCARQEIQATELQHAELEESAAAQHRQRERDQERAAAAQREKDVVETAVMAAERRLAVLQQQAEVRLGCDCTVHNRL